MYISESVVVETNMTIIDCQWNHNGTILAAAGCTKEQANAIQFFSAYGEVLDNFNISIVIFLRLLYTKQ